MSTLAISHSNAFKARRFLNWFPLGLSYALLYMGRYNLTVAKTSLDSLMTKEDFGIIFGAGTFVYAFAFLINGPLVDRYGGRFGMLLALSGSALANVLMGLYLAATLASGAADGDQIRIVFSVLYGLNMYFQSFGAVAIVKVNSHWFHVKERGGFSGIFGTMISSGIFLAFTVNAWLLDVAAKIRPGEPVQWVVFLAPAALLAVFFAVELWLLRDRPAQAGFEDFDTADASSGENLDAPVPTREILKRILTNPIILTIAAVEFCTGVLRNGVMHWFPIYAKEVWALPGTHVLRYGSWDYPAVTATMLVVAVLSGYLGRRASGPRKAYLYTMAGLAFMAPFLQGGWGGLLFIAGVIGGNVAGWVSDLVFQSRRAPAAAGLYGLLAVCTLGMVFSLSPPTNEVVWAKDGSGLQAGDRILSIAGVSVEKGWAEIGPAVACWKPTCKDSYWNKAACSCSTRADLAIAAEDDATAPSAGFIPARIERGGQVMDVELKDTLPVQRAGDQRSLGASPKLPLSPVVLGVLVFLISLCVIGTHGLLSGTATMDFGGRKGAATAVGIIDGFVYAGTALQSVALGYLTTRDWSFWPVFLLPFAVVGFVLLLRIWHATPTRAGRAAA